MTKWLYLRICDAYYVRWLRHDCEGGFVDRMFCRLPMEPWFIRLAARWWGDPCE